MDEKILENVNERLDEAFERGRQLMKDDEFAQRLETLRLQAENTIREHPVKSVAAGLFAGYLLGKLFSAED